MLLTVAPSSLYSKLQKALCVSAAWWGNDTLQMTNWTLGQSGFLLLIQMDIKEGMTLFKKHRGQSWCLDQNSTLRTAGICPGLWIPSKHILLSPKALSPLFPWLVGHTLMFLLRFCLGEMPRKCWGFLLPQYIFLQIAPFLEAGALSRKAAEAERRPQDIRIKV